LPELARIGRTGDTQQLRDQSRAEFHFRLVEVASMLLLPLLAVALGVPPKRSTSALGVFLSIVIIVAYHKINQYMSDVGELGLIDPLIALWGPFCAFAALIGWMYWQIAHVPGGQPIAGLERSFGKLFQRVMGRFKRRRNAAA
jgi:lipopolysaccharide export system permease protein